MIDRSYRHHVCPSENWDTGVESIVTELKRQGMTPASRVLDVGCGCLRIGKPLIEFLERGSYAGVEPCASVLHAGIEQDLGEELVNQKNPVFLYTPIFDFSPLAGKFDFVLVNQVFIHVSAEQFAAFLARVKPCLNHGGKILLTVNIGFDLATPKSAAVNSLEDKRRHAKFLYTHADNAATYYTEETFGMLVASAGFQDVTLHEYNCGKHIIRMKMLNRIRMGD